MYLNRLVQILLNTFLLIFLVNIVATDVGANNIVSFGPIPQDSYTLFWPLVAGKTEEESFYFLKTFKEQVRGLLILGDLKKAEYLMTLSNKRVLEAEKLGLVRLEDILKTAKSFTHDGWPGAKIEYNIPASGNRLEIPRKLYGSDVVGISQLTGYWREKGALNSADLKMQDVEIIRDGKQIIVNILGSPRYELYKAILDVVVKQVDIDQGKIVGFFSTALEKGAFDQQGKVELKLTSKVGSLPKFVYGGLGVGYGWVDNKQVSINLNLNESKDLVEGLGNWQNKPVEVFVAQEDNQTAELPIIEYR